MSKSTPSEEKIRFTVTDLQFEQAQELMRTNPSPTMADWVAIVGQEMAFEIQHSANHDIPMEMVTPRILYHEKHLTEQRTVRKATAALLGGNLHAEFGGGMRLLPAGEDVCAECAVNHAADAPHNKQSMHYQYDFFGQYGRWPTWKDAMAHCTPEVQEEWSKHLTDAGEKLD